VPTFLNSLVSYLKDVKGLPPSQVTAALCIYRVNGSDSLKDYLLTIVSPPVNIPAQYETAPRDPFFQQFVEQIMPAESEKSSDRSPLRATGTPVASPSPRSVSPAAMPSSNPTGIAAVAAAPPSNVGESIIAPSGSPETSPSSSGGTVAVGGASVANAPSALLRPLSLAVSSGEPTMDSAFKRRRTIRHLFETTEKSSFWFAF
jgi:hypothetical protein